MPDERPCLVQPALRIRLYNRVQASARTAKACAPRSFYGQNRLVVIVTGAVEVAPATQCVERKPIFFKIVVFGLDRVWEVMMVLLGRRLWEELLWVAANEHLPNLFG